MRIEKYQKKGFTFTYGPPADIEILDKYLPYGSWIADNYLHDVSTPCFFNPGPMTVDVGSSRITIEDTQAANLLSPKTELEFEALIKNKLDDPSLAELNGYGELRTYYSYDGGCHELTDKVLVPPGLYFPEPEDIPNNKSPKWTSDKTLFACSLRNGDNNMNRYKPILQELFEHRHFHFMDKKEIFLSHRLGANLDSNITRQVEMGFTYLGLYAWSFHCTDMLTKELMLKYPPKNYS
jgi:hypothetical protein